MSAPTRPLVPDARPVARPPVGWHRVAAGVLLAAVGGCWLADVLGASVPWRMLPAAALVVVGLALLATLAGGRGRSQLVALGVALLLTAVGVGVGAGRFVGPVGDRTLVPDPATWTTTTGLAAGTLTVDLTAAAPPESGRMQVRVGAGRVLVRAPAGSRVQIETSVVLGTIVVDGTPVEQGVDLRWAEPGTPAGPVLDVEVGTGDVEVWHVR